MDSTRLWIHRAGRSPRRGHCSLDSLHHGTPGIASSVSPEQLSLTHLRINRFESEVERLAKVAFATKGDRGDPLDAAYLALIATHVEHQRKGVAGYLLGDGAKRFEGLPLLLEATMPNAVRVYKREGYEVVGETKLAPGEVDVDSCLVGDKVEEGLPLYVMVKW